MTTSLLRRGALLITALVIGACSLSDMTGVIPPGHAALLIRADVSGTTIEGIVVEVTGSDIAEPLVFNIHVVDGTGSGQITAPAGSDRTVTARGFDAGGIETHRGAATIDVIEGENPTVFVTMYPLEGQVPVEVTVGSLVVVVEPAVALLPVGESVELSATVFDAHGNVLDWEVTWGSSNPVLFSVDPTGLVTALAEGRAQIVANAGNARGVASVHVPTPVTYTMAYYDVIDLDAGVIYECGSANTPCNDVSDFWFAFNSLRDIHAVVFHNRGDDREIAHLEDRSFDDVTVDDIATAEFTSDLVDAPFDDTRVILLRTDAGAVFKLGQVSETDDVVTFLAEALTLG